MQRNTFYFSTGGAVKVDGKTYNYRDIIPREQNDIITVEYYGQRIATQHDMLLERAAIDDHFYIFHRKKKQTPFRFLGKVISCVVLSQRTETAPPHVRFEVDTRDTSLCAPNTIFPHSIKSLRNGCSRRDFKMGVLDTLGATPYKCSPSMSGIVPVTI